MLSKEELKEIALDILELNYEAESEYVYNNEFSDNTMNKLKDYKRKIAKDWFERFGGNKTNAIFALEGHMAFFYEVGGDSPDKIKIFIESGPFNDYYELSLECRLISLLSYVIIEEI